MCFTLVSHSVAVPGVAVPVGISIFAGVAVPGVSSPGLALWPLWQVWVS